MENLFHLSSLFWCNFRTPLKLPLNVNFWVDFISLKPFSSSQFLKKFALCYDLNQNNFPIRFHSSRSWWKSQILFFLRQGSIIGHWNGQRTNYLSCFPIFHAECLDFELKLLSKWKGKIHSCFFMIADVVYSFFNVEQMVRH